MQYSFKLHIKEMCDIATIFRRHTENAERKFFKMCATKKEIQGIQISQCTQKALVTATVSNIKHFQSNTEIKHLPHTSLEPFGDITFHSHMQQALSRENMRF